MRAGDRKQGIYNWWPNYNNDDSDEFVFRNGSVISNSSSDREIHAFGQSCE